ncbi:beta-lactamase induction protein [Oleiagrimonas sp.]|jgi:AmpE protein|uniref:beta-lactamase induction protein n=1 Tax=Oleiagrimonas sp. TaxID=2010330 RepID=UPI002614DE7B|nr:beta-lactamase induction protein [Oleiagrimonas sp.]MDA3913328.1 beta-lactamase induction protein [Oleiagrimonas sp.]
MAIRLLVVLVVLLLIQLLPTIPSYRRHGWFHRWTAHHSENDGGAFVAWTLLPPLLVCLVLSYVLSHLPLMMVLWAIFAGCVLAYSLGPRDLEQDVNAVLKAPDRAGREQAAQMLRSTDDHSRLPFTAPHLVEAAVWSGLRRRFAVLFWFLLLGPIGALGYRLNRLLLVQAAPDPVPDPDATDVEEEDEHARVDATAEPPATNAKVEPGPTRGRVVARRLGEILDWVPAHLMVFAMALVSDFEAVIKAWRAWHADPGNAARSFDPDFLSAVACASVDADVEAGDEGPDQDTSDALVELDDARRLLMRVLMVWLAIAALIVLGGWFV